ncbi:DUF4123 domain-containing protein [Celeribacter halophilus]|uniref:DUF4123 domain-containing protein n=1 Tax=Celeribacter halophilus TaxID=576117 RepID=UPI003A9401B0
MPIPYAGVFRCDIPGYQNYRLVAGAFAETEEEANNFIQARLAEHEIFSSVCETIVPCRLWDSFYASDGTGARLSAVLKETGQVSFLEYALALPARRRAVDVSSSYNVQASEIADYSPLQPSSDEMVPSALSTFLEPSSKGICYALIDCATTPLLAELIEQSELQNACLFLGDSGVEMRDAAPRLVQLDADSRFTRNLFTIGAEPPRGLLDRVRPVLVRSTESFENLVRHFRRFTRVRAEEDGRWLYFRFQSADTLNQLAPVLQADDASAFFGAAEMMSVTPDRAILYSRAVREDHGDNTPPRPFLMRASYFQSFENAAKNRFCQRLAKDLVRIGTGLHILEAKQLASLALDVCEGVGLTQKDSIAGYAFLCAYLGRSFAAREASLSSIYDPRRSERERKTVIHKVLGHV